MFNICFHIPKEEPEEPLTGRYSPCNDSQPLRKKDTNFYSLGNDVYIYTSKWNDTVFVNIRRVIQCESFTKEGITFNAYELPIIAKIIPELRKADQKGVDAEFSVGKYKKVTYNGKYGILTFQKIDETEDRQAFGAMISLGKKAIYKLFELFPRAEEEFHNIVSENTTNNKRKAPAIKNTFFKRVKQLQSDKKVPVLRVDI